MRAPGVREPSPAAQCQVEQLALRQPAEAGPRQRLEVSPRRLRLLEQRAPESAQEQRQVLARALRLQARVVPAMAPPEVAM